MCVCVCVCVYIYTHTHIYTHTCTQTQVAHSICMDVYVCMYTHTCIMQEGPPTLVYAVLSRELGVEHIHNISVRIKRRGCMHACTLITHAFSSLNNLSYKIYV
jgi:hypothetical protein